MQVHVVTDSLADDGSIKSRLTRALELMHQVIEEGRNSVRGLRLANNASLDLEEAFSRIKGELPQEQAGKVDFGLIVEPERRALHPAVRGEVYRIGRERSLMHFSMQRRRRSK